MRPPTIVSSMESIKNLIMEDVGITIIPRCCVAREMEQGRVREVELEKCPEDIKYYMIERESETESEAAAALKKILDDVKNSKAG